MKHISEKLMGLLDDPMVLTILDRNKDITNIIKEVESWWGFDLFSRKPGPAYDEEGLFMGTDLDLACFLYALKGRGAVINIPVYSSTRATKIKEGQKTFSIRNRHGEIKGVSANKDFFSFSVSILDLNVIGEDKVGFPRNFSLTDFEGNWYKGWTVIQFTPTINENKFITENKLWSGNKIVFKNFIHPNRWTSFFGYYYVVTKLLMDRLEEEASFYYSQMKEMLAKGIKYPDGEGPTEVIYESVEKGKSMKFLSFQTKIYIPEIGLKGDYDIMSHTQENLVSLYNKRKRYVYGILPSLRFMTRATEYAHFKRPTAFPSWIQNDSWEQGFREPGKRTDWERLKLFQPAVGKHSVSILKRTYEKSTMVNENY
jgi:hypothetical protein